MRLACPCCKTDYVIPNGRVPRGYYKVVCSHCGYKWRKAVGVTLNFPAHNIALENNLLSTAMANPIEPNYRPEVLAILREEAKEDQATLCTYQPK